MAAATPTQSRRFETIFSLHSPAILGYLLRRVQPPEDAADLMAEVFAIAWRRIDDVPTGEETRLWLYGVARNLLSNHRRGMQRRDKLTERLREEVALRALRTPLPESGLALEVREALAALSEADREVLTLSVWEGLKPGEIAEHLGLEPGTVRARLSRARSRLRQLLHPQLHAAETP